MILSAFFLLLGTFFIIRFIMGGNEDFWFCRDDQWKKQGNPRSAAPIHPCVPKITKNSESSNDQADQNINQPNTSQNLANIEQKSNEDIKLISPQKDDTVSGILQMLGEAPGKWFFEGGFPVKILDENEKEIAQGRVSSYGEWMKDGLIPFHAELDFSKDSGSGWLVLQKDNPSGMAENGQDYRIPVQFGRAKNQIVRAFFGSNYLDPEHKNCAKVFSVERAIDALADPARSALDELLKGLKDPEKQGGYFTGINAGVTINSLTIVGGIAKADFNGKLQEQIGGSCLVAMIRSQITETLKQFSTVKEVVISIDGKSQDILQP